MPKFSGAISRTNWDKHGERPSVKDWGATSGRARLLYFTANITASSAILSISSGSFSAGDIGFTVVVYGAGAAGASLVATVSSFTDSTHVVLSVAAGTTVTSAFATIGPDDTSALIAALVTSSASGASALRQLPVGYYHITPGQLLIPNPQSGIFEGGGARFGSVLISNNPAIASPVLTLGDGTFEPHSFILRNLSIDANGGTAALYFNRTNLMAVRDVIIQGLGKNGVGIDTPNPAILFGEMIFDHCSVYGMDGLSTPSGSIGARIYAGSNVEFLSCNFENLDHGVIFTGMTQCRLHVIGGRMERMGGFALILSTCQPTIDLDLAVGQVYLDNAVVNGELHLSNSAGTWGSGGLADCGFGNKIVQTATQITSPTDKSSTAPGINFRGDEWLSVSGLVDDPTFIRGIGSWTPIGDGVLGTSPISMPGVSYGASMLITSAGGGGGASRTFTAATNTDYLVQVGLVTRKDETYRVVVSNSGGTVWDSGTLSYTYAASDYQAIRIIRKSIPVVADTVFTVAIYAGAVGQTTTVPLLLISRSNMQMASNYATNGSGFSTSGSGPSLTWNQNTTTGNVYSLQTLAHVGRGFVRAVVTVPVGVVATMGGVNTFNNKSAGPQFTFREGTFEYIIPLMSVPAFNTFIFYSLVNGGAINIKEVGVYTIDDSLPLPLSPTGYLRNAPGSGIDNLTADATHLDVGSTRYSGNWQAASSAGNGFKRVIYASNIYWDQANLVWQVPANGGGDWAAVVMLNGGDIAFASEAGLTLPTTRTNTQFNAAIRFTVPAAGGSVVFNNAASSFTFFWGSGSPEGVVTSATGGLYVNVSGGSGTTFYIKQTGSGNTGWAAPVSVSGVTATIATAKLTGGGANGSMTFTNGALTAQTPAT